MGRAMKLYRSILEISITMNAKSLVKLIVTLRCGHPQFQLNTVILEEGLNT